MRRMFARATFMRGTFMRETFMRECSRGDTSRGGILRESSQGATFRATVDNPFETTWFETAVYLLSPVIVASVVFFRLVSFIHVSSFYGVPATSILRLASFEYA